ncbi:MAG: protein phosphatase 2C domain-containing protein [Candidatus Obscuribacterales bacterium]|jgi:hypothetical protein|nr:protein phosphatase 2C domain-containing protein [Candidatus Obscuribacterales bacterium]
MKICYRVFWLPKRGSSIEEYEDAFAPGAADGMLEDSNNELESKQFKCAVADGATETSFSGLWARILCKSYIDGELKISDNEILGQLQRQWFAEVSGRQLPWYAEEKLASGAFATIAGLTISEEKKQWSWSVTALGDSCFFQIRDKQVVASAPLSKWEDFNYNPALLSTRQASNEGILQEEKNESGQCKKGDVIYLMTDAISKWFLHRQALQGDAVSILENLNDKSAFAELVDEARNEKDSDGRPMMPNDDVTWTRISLS